MARHIEIDDGAIITEVAALGGYVPISRAGKWAIVAQRLGLKAARAADVQKRYEMLLNNMPDDDDDDDDAAGAARGDEDGDEADEAPLLEGEELVERIIGERIKSGCKQYMVKWANIEESTWEPAESLVDCTDILNDWKRSEAAKKARELGAASRKRVASEPAPVDERQRKRGGASAPQAVQNENDGTILTGLLEHDTIVSVRGPVNMSLQWLVSWRSGRLSTLTNAQCRAEASGALLDWYESNLVIDQNPAPPKPRAIPAELVG